MPKKRCMAPSCYAIVQDGSRCEKHQIKKKKEVYEDRQRVGRANAHIYDTQRWRRLSHKAKIIAGGLCEMCLKEGRESYGDVSDHIIEISDGGAPYDLKNIQVLCHFHHNNKTKQEAKKRNEPKDKPDDGLVYI